MNETMQPLPPNTDDGPLDAPGIGRTFDFGETSSTGETSSDSEMSSDSEVSFADFVATRSQALLRAAYLLTGDVELAEDLLQTALAKSSRRWRRVDRDGGGEAYVRKVLHTTYASRWRRRWRSETPTARPSNRDAAEDAPAPTGADERTAVMRALSGLHRAERSVVVLRYFEDRTEAETAQILGCAVGTVQSRTARALRALRSSPFATALIQENQEEPK